MLYVYTIQLSDGTTEVLRGFDYYDLQAYVNQGYSTGWIIDYDYEIEVDN